MASTILARVSYRGCSTGFGRAIPFINFTAESDTKEREDLFGDGSGATANATDTPTKSEAHLVEKKTIPYRVSKTAAGFEVGKFVGNSFAGEDPNDTRCFDRRGNYFRVNTIEKARDGNHHGWSECLHILDEKVDVAAKVSNGGANFNGAQVAHTTKDVRKW
ncbi:hypothetical protein BC936DRAFT_141986 [Jimgerdemannia flammicorona]|uniref:Uncharacterized protein n=1 Tax=Jimgerdemannia flammicorona TaxID=994334 RepID=A0A433DFM8_9FUNG|nr:hypothetical protein BC936DRAFT_141986 [Jimgerdemannia flammicorona]